ncbi:restriction endonuclease subunit S [Chryseobacterium indologenes]|uniref:restriction endonuclease subunit S n=1 Tax=Chryseobacterium indologenes TaxID=253 RepID=UPI001BCA9B29|nr:restriction endonuclease subunit S [Chryseobacterium indologenes]
MTNKKLKVSNVPNLRFPGFEGEWEVKKLGEVCEIKTGNKDTQNKISDGEYPFFVRSNTVERIDSYSYDGEAILTSGDGVGVGKNFHYIDGKFDFHQRVYALRNFKEEYNGKYIYHLFSEKFYDRIRKLSAKNSVDSVRMDMISGMKIYFPVVLEQKKIASFLSLIDERIITQNKILLHYQSLIQKLRNDIFKQKLRFKDDFGNKFSEWEIYKLSDISKRITQKNSENNQNVLTISAQLGLISQLDFFNKSVSSKNVLGYYLLIQNDFAYNKSYSNGYPMGAIKRLKMYEKGIVSTLYICFRFNESVSIDFMEQYFESGIQNIEIEKIAQEGARNHGLLNVGISDFFDIKISIPCIGEQKQIASFLFKIDSKIQTEKAILEQLERQKKYLLQQMLV